ncbi:MAG: UDP-N-acetylglucosamine-peptide N-acetylglucosaminyltransferase, partial [Chloroflexi bacterium]|nr:UDP-N-acetylglucosamine-peptide N-acetylglucosaminyltransferase [Chloroflexota bacterium]
ELITYSIDEYESAAIYLAKNPIILETIKEKLSLHRANFPLFDSSGFVSHLEAAYLEMHRRMIDGLLPMPFSVS